MTGLERVAVALAGFYGAKHNVKDLECPTQEEIKDAVALCSMLIHEDLTDLAKLQLKEYLK